MAKKIRITQEKSGVGEPGRIRRTLRALGFQRHQQTVEHEDNPAIRGMIAKVQHLVKVEEA
ncbi:MAG: 50S ribosomal protein L30 [Gemmatimonadota bacterium]|nr:50S ribosomal protein L30 [Gemmatimonadota bacterium]